MNSLMYDADSYQRAIRNNKRLYAVLAIDVGQRA